MKAALCLLGVLAAANAIGTPARAQNRPWCAFYEPVEATNCGFVTYEQCLATVSGVGGYCEPNTMYVPPYVPPHGPTRRHPRRPHQS